MMLAHIWGHGWPGDHRATIAIFEACGEATSGSFRCSAINVNVERGEQESRSPVMSSG